MTVCTAGSSPQTENGHPTGRPSSSHQVDSYNRQVLWSMSSRLRFRAGRSVLALLGVVMVGCGGSGGGGGPRDGAWGLVGTDAARSYDGPDVPAGNLDADAKIDGGPALDSSPFTSAWRNSQEAFEAIAKTSVVLEWNDSLGSPSFVAFDQPYALPGLTHDPSHPEATALAFFDLSRPAWSAQIADTFQLSATSLDPSGPASATLTQLYRGVPVDGARITVVMSKTGQVEFVIGGFVPNLSLDVSPTISEQDAVAIVTGSGAVVDPSHAVLSIRIDSTVSPSAVVAWRVPFIASNQNGTAWVDARNGSVFARDLSSNSGLYQEIYSKDPYPADGMGATPDWTSATPPPSDNSDAFKVYDATMKFDAFISGYGFSSFTGRNDWYKNVVLAGDKIEECKGQLACFDPQHSLEEFLSPLEGLSLAQGPKAIFTAGISKLDQVSHEWGHGLLFYTGLLGNLSIDQQTLHEAIADCIASLVVCAQPQGCTWTIQAPVPRDLSDPNSKFFQNCEIFATDYLSFLYLRHSNPNPNPYDLSTAFSNAFYRFACDQQGLDCLYGVGQRKAATILLRAIRYRSLASSPWNTLKDARLGLVRTCEALALDSIEGISHSDCNRVDQVFSDLFYPWATSQLDEHAVPLPSAPTNVIAAYQEGRGSNHVSWHAVPGASAYIVHWGTVPVTTDSPILPTTSSLGIDHPKVSVGLTYRYRVAAVGADGREGALSDEVLVTVPMALPDGGLDGGAVDDGPAVGTGGVVGTGGIVATGGIVGTGGIGSTGGIVGTGGVVGTGGWTTTPAQNCSGLAATCGPSGNENCCSSIAVSGGTFNRSNNVSYPATVSNFVLDKYEVTVGRFRAFVDAGEGIQSSPPAPGDGAHPLIAGSGWDSSWNASLLADSDTLKSNLKCQSGIYPEYTWTDSPSAGEGRPINCVSWYEAFAFCAWDGGRLPTEAEWNYAAAGGSEQRKYPWGATEPGTNASLAIYNCYYNGPGGLNGCTGVTNIAVVGTAPAGNGKWGHADLAGSVEEWNLDWMVSGYPAPCNDCANLASADQRVLRGGDFQSDAFWLESDTRNGAGTPWRRMENWGFRCARTSAQ